MARLNVICHRMEPVSAADAIMIVAGLAGQFELCKAAKLRFRITANEMIRFRLPVPGQVPNVSPSDVDALAKTLYEAIATANAGPISAVAMDPSEDLDGALWLPRDVLAMVPFACRFEASGEQSGAGRKLLLVDRAKPDASESVAAFIRAGRNVELAAVDAGTSADRFVAVFFDDEVEEMAMTGGLIASGRLSASGQMFVGHDTVSGRLYLPPQYRPPELSATDTLSQLGTLLPYLSEGDNGAAPSAFIIWPESTDTDAKIGLFRLQEAVAAPLDEMFEGEAVTDAKWSVVHADLKGSPEAAQSLVDDIVRQKFQLGYRPQLHVLPAHLETAGAAEMESLQERVFELQAELDMMNLDQTRQQRLLRFTDDQLPALVDGLRRIPKPLLDKAKILYGAHHAVGRDRPDHFLIYNIADVPLGTHLPEEYWRFMTSDLPMIYHLDPFCADALDRRSARSRIFVPKGQVLAPSLGDFGGDLDQTLKLMVGRWFGEIAGLYADPEAQPTVIFTNAASAAFDLEVECLDLAKMAPIALRLPWINDYLQLRGSSTVNREDLDKVSAEIYRGDAAATITALTDGTVATMRETWDAHNDQLATDVAQGLNTFRLDIETSVEYLKSGFEALAAARKVILELEDRLADATTLLQASARAEQSIAKLPDQLSSDRSDLVRSLSSELELNERTHKEVEQKLRDMHDRLEDVRRWGRGG